MVYDKNKMLLGLVVFVLITVVISGVIVQKKLISEKIKFKEELKRIEKKYVGYIEHLDSTNRSLKSRLKK